MTVDLFKQHRDIIDASEALLATLKRRPDIDMDALNRQRRQLEKSIREHRRCEQELIYLPLRAHDLPDALRRLQPTADELMREKIRYSEHIRHWTPHTIQADWDGYAAAVEARIAMMHSTIHTEEDHLYRPVLAYLASAPEALRATATR